MIRINLLPPEFAEERAKQEQQLFFGSIGVVIVTILFLVFGFEKIQEKRLQRKIAEAKAEEQRYQNILAEMQNIQNRKTQLAAKRDVIRDLNRSRLVYPVFFEDFLPIIPSDIWVNNMSITESGLQLQIKLDSNALSNYALANFLTNLQQSKHFSGVEFGPVSYTKDKTDQPPILKFTMDFTYHHQGPFPLEEFN